MSLSLYVDHGRFEKHLREVVGRYPGLVPVAKGNGYGLTNSRLAMEAQRFGADTLAIGTYEELEQVSGLFTGSLLVLTPWRPFGASAGATGNPRLVHTVSRLADLQALLAADPTVRIVLERMTSMRRHGLSARSLRTAAEMLAQHRDATLEGVTFHFPLAHGGGHLPELHALVTDVVASGLKTRTLWVSHLGDAELVAVRSSYPDFTFRPRIGTGLWLGDRGALAVKAHVLDVHPLERAVPYGYRGRSMPRRGHLLVVSGGTAHGIGLEAPAGDLSLRSRAATMARGSLDAAGLVKSPYVVDGKQRFFAEPPHMQSSMLWLPDDARAPEVGDEVELRVRYTTTSFDRTVLS